MEEDNQYFLSAFNAIPLPVAIKDANAKFLLVNEEYKKVVCMNQTDYQGLDVTHLAYFSDEDREVFYENCKYAIDQSAIVQQEFSLGLDDEQRNYVYWLSGFETESRKKGLVSIYYDATFFQSILNRLNKKVVDLEQEQQNIIKNSALDPLTGAYNRNVLAGFLEEAFKEASEKGRDFCLLMLDIDYFKAVNDTFGHLVGDQVLQLLVMLLQKRCVTKIMSCASEARNLSLFCIIPFWKMLTVSRSVSGILWKRIWLRRTISRLPSVSGLFPTVRARA